MKSNNLNKQAPALVPSTLALAISGAMLSGVAVADTTKEGEAVELDKVKVEETVTPDTNPYAVPGAPYLAEVSDPRRTAPIEEIPQMITVLTATEMAETGRSDLRDILDAQPGITLGTGENGNAFGDRYVIRGHEARSDVFVDGLRDPGMTIRESFATEQVEISKGPSATFAGRGTTGGSVNSATKRASSEFDFTNVSVGVGSDSYQRLTLDTNQVIDYDTAIRINALSASEDVPDRAPANRERNGAAISVNHQASDKLEVTADYYYLDADEKPDLGSSTNSNGEVYADMPVYAQDNDFLESTVETFTLRLGYELDPKSSIVNLTRYGTTDNGYGNTGAKYGTAYPTQADVTAGTNGYNSVTLDGGHNGWQEVEYFANQFNYLTSVESGDLIHELITSVEYSNHKVLNGKYVINDTGTDNCWTDGRRGASSAVCVMDANGNLVSNLNSILGRTYTRDAWDSDWSMETVSLSVMDTVALDDKLTVSGGARYDYYDYSNVTTTTTYENSDGMLNGHLGFVFDVAPEGNVYATVSTASNLNGGESDLGASCGYGGVCVDSSDPTNLGDPEKTLNLEIGTKWRLADDKLLATASAFQITKSNVFESADGNSYATTGTLNTGKNRVKGIELGLVGNVTDKLSVQAGVAMMDSEILDSVDASNIGGKLSNFAENSASLHMSYKFTPKLTMGGTATYESERYAGQPDDAAGTNQVPAYTVFDAFASYDLSRDMTLRLNVENLFDKDYYLAAYRSGAFVYIGDARSVKLTLESSF